MRYTKLGNSDLSVSRICLGCIGFGDARNGQHSWTVDEAHSREIIKRALELGINFFDTAIGYQSGTSEQYVGRPFEASPDRGRGGNYKIASTMWRAQLSRLTWH